MEALRGYGSDSSEGGGRDPGSPPEAKRARTALPGAELALAGGAEALYQAFWAEAALLVREGRLGTF